MVTTGRDEHEHERHVLVGVHVDKGRPAVRAVAREVRGGPAGGRREPAGGRRRAGRGVEERSRHARSTVHLVGTRA
jgi:hypothetical protein